MGRNPHRLRCAQQTRRAFVESTQCSHTRKLFQAHRHAAIIFQLAGQRQTLRMDRLGLRVMSLILSDLPYIVQHNRNEPAIAQLAQKSQALVVQERSVFAILIEARQFAQRNQRDRAQPAIADFTRQLQAVLRVGARPHAIVAVGDGERVGADDVVVARNEVHIRQIESPVNRAPAAVGKSDFVVIQIDEPRAGVLELDKLGVVGAWLIVVYLIDDERRCDGRGGRKAPRVVRCHVVGRAILIGHLGSEDHDRARFAVGEVGVRVESETGRPASDRRRVRAAARAGDVEPRPRHIHRFTEVDGDVRIDGDAGPAVGGLAAGSESRVVASVGTFLPPALKEALIRGQSGP